MIRLLLTSVTLALGQVRANAVRSLLATLGIVIGIASVTAVIAALGGLQERVLSDFAKFGANTLRAYPRYPEEGPLRNAPWERINFGPDEADGLLAAAPSIETFTRTGSLSDAVTHGGETAESVDVTGIDAAWHAIERRGVTAGRPFGVVDELNARSVCLVTQATVDNLKMPADPVGSSIETLDRRFTVVGVVEPDPAGGNVFGMRGEQEEVFVPYATLARIGRPMTRLKLLATSPDAVASAEGELRYFLRQKRGLSPTDPDTFGVFVLQEVIADFQRLATAVTAVAGGIVSISLLVGGVGIMNIMLVSVSERTREIGLRKAVGATPAALLLQFLIEAVVLCTLGGLIGLLLGQVLVLGLKRIPGAGLDAAAIPAWAALLALGFSSAVGIAFGFFPALKAARLDPIEALRYE